MFFAQQVPFAVFAAEAVITPLINHGRQWSVSFRGQDLGFADGPQEEALRQVHRGEVNNALYSLILDAIEGLQKPLPSVEALLEYPDLLAKFPEAKLPSSVLVPLNDSLYLGKRIEMILMPNDPCPIEPGDKGVVDHVDALGQLHVQWESGRTLAVVTGHDQFRVIS